MDILDSLKYSLCENNVLVILSFFSLFCTESSGNAISSFPADFAKGASEGFACNFTLSFLFLFYCNFNEVNKCLIIIQV